MWQEYPSTPDEAFEQALGNVRERVADVSDRVDRNRDEAAAGLSELTRVVEANAAAAAELGLALQTKRPAIPDEPDLD